MPPRESGQPANRLMRVAEAGSTDYDSQRRRGGRRLAVLAAGPVLSAQGRVLAARSKATAGPTTAVFDTRARNSRRA